MAFAYLATSNSVACINHRTDVFSLLEIKEKREDQYIIYLLFFCVIMKDPELLVQRVLRITISSRVMLLVYGFTLFAIPLLLSWPQLLVGSIVNVLLIMVAIRYKNYKTLLPFAVLPSIAAVVHGVLFGPFSVFLIYMMPAIRVGNFLLMYVIQHDKYLLKGILSGVLYKAIFLAIVAYILIYLWVLPIVFLKAMGFYQLITALIAGVVVYLGKNYLLKRE